MKTILSVLAAGCLGTSAWASTLNLTVKSGASSEVTVAPGGTISFSVEGILNNDLNEGLALVGFDLHFTGGALPANAVETPTGTINCSNPMPAFVIPEGITNPAGYGGTLIGGDLVQVGGGQNTIKNSVDNPACAPNCAQFPIGTPILGVAQPSVCGTAVIAEGSFAAPLAAGDYQLQILNGFANVIKDGEQLANAFLATEAATVSVTANLIVHVSAESCDGIVSTIPASCSVDARQPHAPNNPGAAQGWNSIDLTFGGGCDVSGAAPGDFTVDCNPAGAPCPTISNVATVDQTVTVNLSAVIPAGKWTCVTHTATGDMACLGSLPADTNSNLTSAPADILELIDHLNGVRVPPLVAHQCDIDRTGICNPSDILSEIDLLNGANGFEVWNGRNVAACPAAQ